MSKIRFASEEYVNNHSFSGDYEDLANKPFYREEAWTFISDTFSQSNTALIVKRHEDLYSNCFKELGRYRFTINGTDIYEYEKTSTGTTPQGFIIGDFDMQTIPFALRRVQSTDTETWFQIVGPLTGITSCKAEYYTSSAKHLDDIFLSSNIARTEDQVGLKTLNGGEIFNDTANNKAQATYAHAEGKGTEATGQASHAEGVNTMALGNYAHAEGGGTIASGNYSHAEGGGTNANGIYTHAEGWETTADGNNSHAEGEYTTASGEAQHVEGKYNIESTNFAHIVGNGTSPSIRKNAHTLDWNGNAWYAGDVYVGSTSGKNKDEGSKKLATEEYVNIRVPDWTSEDEGKVLKIVNGTPTWVAE